MNTFIRTRPSPCTPKDRSSSCSRSNRSFWSSVSRLYTSRWVTWGESRSSSSCRTSPSIRNAGGAPAVTCRSDALRSKSCVRRFSMLTAGTLLPPQHVLELHRVRGPGERFVAHDLAALDERRERHIHRLHAHFRARLHQGVDLVDLLLADQVAD